MIRFLICILAIAVSSASSFGQDRIADWGFPFQVLYAENCTNKEGKTINSFDSLSIDEAIHIGIDGTITMVHQTGLPIEINEDTLILIRNLHEVIVPPRKDEKKRSKKEESIPYVSRPRMENLLATDWRFVTGRSQYLSIRESAIDLQCPFEINNKIYVVNDLSIKWEEVGVNDFSVELIGLFNEEITTFSVSTNELKMDSLTIHKMLDDYTGVLLSVAAKTESLFPGPLRAVILKYPFPYFGFDFSCDTKSASMALLLGYYLEFYGQDTKESAKYFYERATQLSDKEFFRAMLNNFNMRMVR